MLRPALLLSALLLTLGAPVSGATVADVSVDPIVEVRECHSRYDSFQLYVNGEPASDCFVFCCEETAASGPVEVRECHSSQPSFQVYVDDEPVTRCLVLCCDEATAGAADPVVEVRQCHYRESFQVFVNDEPVTPCFVFCCEEAEASADGPEVRPCPGGYYVVWDPYFVTTCIPVPLGGPEVQSCGGRSFRVVWYPYFETTCIP